jgi:hypothetical protein
VRLGDHARAEPLGEGLRVDLVGLGLR